MSKMYIDILVSLPPKITKELLIKNNILNCSNGDHYGYCTYIDELDKGFYDDEFPSKFNIFEYKTNISFWTYEPDLKNLSIPWAYILTKQISQKLKTKTATFINSFEDLLWEFNAGVCIVNNLEKVPAFSWQPPI